VRGADTSCWPVRFDRYETLAWRCGAKLVIDVLIDADQVSWRGCFGGGWRPAGCLGRPRESGESPRPLLKLPGGSNSAADALRARAVGKGMA